MASKSMSARVVKKRNLAKDFMYWALAVFIIKLIVISNLQGGAWLGADGENYLSGFESLLIDGIFSENSKLTYWPAGYPLFILLLSFFGKSFVFTTLSIVQSALFSYSVYFFSTQILKTRLRNFAYFVFLIILLNPTLSLSSYVVGYESLAASGYLFVFGLIIKSFVDHPAKNLKLHILLTSAILSFITFLQPRFLISAVLINLVWIFLKFPKKSASLFLLLSLIVTLVLPASLIYRNNIAVGLMTISTNLGGTMSIGSGDQANGSYNPEFSGPPCQLFGSESQMDNQRVACALKWYLDNPTKSIRLFLNKTQYFWSPWTGPLVNGTMARNPSLPINPIDSIRKTPDGNKLVYGSFGKLISWLWLLSGLVIMFYGFRILWRLKSLERLIGVLAMITVGSSWIISLFTIGDHRFRLPIMGMSLFLQAVGLRTLLKGGKPPMVDGPGLR
jgi:hypothetical protein